MIENLSKYSGSNRKTDISNIEEKQSRVTNGPSDKDLSFSGLDKNSNLTSYINNEFLQDFDSKLSNFSDNFNNLDN